MTSLFPSLKLIEKEKHIVDGNPFGDLLKPKSRLGSSAFPPTAVQLYTSKFIHFPSCRIFPTKRSSDAHEDETNLAPRPFEILSYQAVQVSDVPLTQQMQQQQQQQQQQQLQLNMGIWSSYLPDTMEKNILLASSTLNGVLFSDPCNKIPTFLFTIDLLDPATVYSTVTAMIQTILKLYEKLYSSSASSVSTFTSDHTENKKSSSSSSLPFTDTTHYHPSLRTTAISTMASTVFGQAPSSSSNDTPAPVLNDASEDSIIRLVLCAILPPHTSSKKLNYKQVQAQRLVQYHLHRYASALNCTLLFVQDTTTMESTHMTSSSSTASFQDIPPHSDSASISSQHSNKSTQQTTMGIEGLTIHEVTLILRKIVDFQPEDMIAIIPQSSTESSSVLQESEIPLSVSSPSTLWLRQQELLQKIESKESTCLFLPDSHDKDIIESVLVRNATCSGIWDAYKDPLWIALKSISPATTTITNTTTDGKNTFLGEQEWLSKLADALSHIAYSNPMGGGGGGETKSVFSDTSSLSGADAVESISFIHKKNVAVNDSSSSSPKNITKKKVENSHTTSKMGTEDDDVANFFDDLLK